MLGGMTVIGAKSRMGANVFLMHSVPPDSLVVYEEKQLKLRNKRERDDRSVSRGLLPVVA
jgi:serine O-acetyltransferase